MTKTLTIASDLNCLSQVEQFVDEFCTKAHVSQDIYGNILVSLSEAASNAILHGNKSDENKRVQIKGTLDDELKILAFEVTDEGRGFDFALLPDPTSPQKVEQENGRGVFLMRILADFVTYSKDGSTVEMKFKI